MTESKAVLGLTAVNLYSKNGAIASENGTAVDLLDYDGLGVVVLNVGRGGTDTDETLDVKLQHGALADGSDAADLPAGVAADKSFTPVVYNAGSVQTKILDMSTCKRYLRAVPAVAGTTPVFYGSITFLGQKKVR